MRNVGQSLRYGDFESNERSRNMQGVSISKKSPRRPKPRFIPGSAIQFFILKVDFVGTQLFGAEVPIVIGRHYKSAIRLEDETVSCSPSSFLRW